MSVTVHQRPGVYSSYDASSVASSGGSGRLVGLAGISTKAEAGKLQLVTSYDQAVELFGSDGEEGMAELIRLALQNGAGGVAAVAVAGEEDYETAFELLAGTEDLAAVLCGSTGLEVQQKLRDSVVQASQARRERVAVVAGAAGESVEELVTRAKGINHERVVLAAPGGLSRSGQALSSLTVAAAIAGVLAGEQDPAVPLGGAELRGLPGLDGQYRDGELDVLILGGVTPAESLSGRVSVVRGVTTRTTTGGAADATWRELAMVRIVDNVIPSLRDALRSKFQRAKNTPQSRSAIRAQVILELENKLAREIITGYDSVSVTADSTDPTRCLVDFSFAAAHGLNQIWLTAHISV